MALTRPDVITTVWASGASGPYITDPIPQTGTGTGGYANWLLGFPPSTFGLGAYPPGGYDVNGVLYTLSGNLQWLHAGRWAAYSSALSTALGGYPKGAVLCLSDDYTYVISTADNNTNDPNSGIGSTYNWEPFGGPLAGAGAIGTTGGSANAYTLTTNLPMATPAMGARVAFSPNFTNSGAATLNGVLLLRNDSANVAAGDIVSGSLYTAIYDGATWVLTAPTISQMAAAASGGLFAVQHAFTAPTGRNVGNVYTNTTGKPMYLSVRVVTGSTNNELQLYIDSDWVGSSYAVTPGGHIVVSGIVPPGSTYEVLISGSAYFYTDPNWFETY